MLRRQVTGYSISTINDIGSLVMNISLVADLANEKLLHLTANYPFEVSTVEPKLRH
jgi:hypothetical protein